MRAWRGALVAIMVSLSACAAQQERFEPDEAPSRSAATVRDRTITNALIVETMVVTYARAHDGAYPDSVESLRQAATGVPVPYWRTLVNPLDGSAPALVTGERPVAGAVGYTRDAATGGYRILAWDANGEPYKLNDGQVFVLSN